MPLNSRAAFVHIVDRLRHAFAEERFRVAVAQLPGFMNAGARPLGTAARPNEPSMRVT